MKASVWIVIPCAGKGSRFNSSTPKQHHSLLDKTVLQQTLQRFLVRDDINGIVLAVAKDDPWLASYSLDARVHVVEGGKERKDSVYNALVYLQSRVQDNDLIAVHDAARPCIRQSSLDLLLSKAVNGSCGAILALPATDTVKFIQLGTGDAGSGENVIEETLDRDQIWLAQTPQVFPYALLKNALEQAQQKNVLVTDESSAVELSGYNPQVVAGEKDNIKITTADDLVLAEFYLSKILKEGD